jgi:hypothetical protein
MGPGITRWSTRSAKLDRPLGIESRRERARMAAKKKTRQSSAKRTTAKRTTSKSTTVKKAPRKAAASKAAKVKKATAGKGSQQPGDVVYSDLRKIALARGLVRR